MEHGSTEEIRNADDNIKDPVCGMDVDPKHATDTSKFKGKTYYFCSSNCRQEFENDPKKFA